MSVTLTVTVNLKTGRLAMDVEYSVLPSIKRDRLIQENEQAVETNESSLVLFFDLFPNSQKSAS